MKNPELIAVGEAMKTLYADLREGRIELKTASELSNITGKYLKAWNLDFAERVFLSGEAKNPVDGVIEREDKFDAAAPGNSIEASH